MDENNLQPQLINFRIANAVDVSSALDNCFFNSYAAYLLSNKLPLPNDLFTPNPANKNTPAEKLKETFKGADDLEIFNAYHQQKYPNAESSEMLAEKTLVLGVLCRENFANQLSKDEEHKDQLFENNDENKISFLKIIDSYRDFGRETVLADDRIAPIYESNREFFDGLSQTPQANEKDGFRAYWDQQGYENYCQHLAKPGVQVSITDFDPILKAQNIPYTLYSKQDGSITAQNTGDTSKPTFELVISGAEAHYSLLKNSTTETSLNDYAASMAQYKADREAIVSMQGTPESKVKACTKMPSQLVGAICPKGEVGNPVNILIARCAEIKSNVSQANLNVGDNNHQEYASENNNENNNEALTEREQRVLDATASTQADPEKYKSYKNEVKSLIIEGRKGFSNDPNNAIPKEDIENAEAFEGETDEEFAERLQDSELKGAGLK